MKHTFSADPSAFETLESAQDYLCDSFTRNQALVIRRAVEHAWTIRHHQTGYPEALYVAAQLKSMRADVPIMISALLGTDASAKAYPIELVHEQFGSECARLTKGVRWLNELVISDSISEGTQAETLRRMVLSMVEDVRVVLVKLAYRTQRLYSLVKSEDASARDVAQETLAVYAPLANRLGLGQLKWELEDVAFRIVEPVAYKRVAKALEENRASRETFITDFVADLSARIEQHGIANANVFGRPKHIYSRAYKEGSAVDVSLQNSINALKQLLEENTDDEQLIEGFSQQLDAHRVYVFTPKGEVIDLTNGATPLDFAYHIHSEIGHRCRGAKVNGRIVQLTHVLCNGDQVEVLTTREPGPSRDWLNKSLGYINSSRARGKVRAWFNQQDHEQHLTDGRALLDRELKRLKAGNVSLDTIVKRLKFDKPNDLYVAIGRNDITAAQIAGAIGNLIEPAEKSPELVPRAPAAKSGSDGISVRGVGNLLTHIAPCCMPVPPDSIVGFITRGKGVTIHRADCSNILNLRDSEIERLIDVDWGDDVSGRYHVEIFIKAIDRHGLLRDVSTTLSSLDVDVVSVNTLSNKEMQTADMRIGLHISDTGELALAMDKLSQLRNVQDVERVS